MRVSSNVYPQHAGFGAINNGFNGSQVARVGNQYFTFPHPAGVADRTVYPETGHLKFSALVTVDSYRSKTTCIPMGGIEPTIGEAFQLYHVRAFLSSTEDVVRGALVVGRCESQLSGSEVVILSKNYFFVAPAFTYTNYGNHVSFDQVIALKADSSDFTYSPVLFGMQLTNNGSSTKSNVAVQGHLSVRRYVSQHHYFDPYVS